MVIRSSGFGLPPVSWQGLTSVLQQVAGLAMVGYSVDHDRPVLAIVSAAVMSIVWITKPTLRVARRGIAEKFAKRINTDL